MKTDRSVSSIGLNSHRRFSKVTGRDAQGKIDSLVETSSSAKSPSLTIAPGPFFEAVLGSYERIKNPQITLEQVADAANTLATVLWKHQQRHSPTHVATCCHYYQERNEASYRSRRRRGRRTKSKVPMPY